MNRYRSKSAFTLFELIVAMAITSVMAAFIFSFAGSLTKLWSKSQSAISTELDANIALDTIAMDLEGAVFLEGNGVMFAVKTQDYDERKDSGIWKAGSARETTNDFDPDNHVYGWAGSWLRFFTAAPTLNAVSYQIVRREAFTGSKIRRYVLYRSVVRQDRTQTTGFDIMVSAYSDKDAPGPALEHYPKTIRKPTVSGYLLEDVVDFGVRLYVYEADAPVSADSSRGLRLIYPSTDFSALSSTDRLHEADSDEPAGNDYSQVYPDVVEVFIRMIDSAGSEKLRAIEMDGTDGTFEDVVAEHGRVYSRMVRIISSFN